MNFQSNKNCKKEIKELGFLNIFKLMIEKNKNTFLWHEPSNSCSVIHWVTKNVFYEIEIIKIQFSEIN